MREMHLSAFYTHYGGLAKTIGAPTLTVPFGGNFVKKLYKETSREVTRTLLTALLALTRSATLSLAYSNQYPLYGGGHAGAGLLGKSSIVIVNMSW